MKASKILALLLISNWLPAQQVNSLFYDKQNQLVVDTSLISKDQVLDYFNCNYYSYYKDTAHPVVTSADSAEVKRYSEKFHAIAHKNNPTYKADDISFLPYIKGFRDTLWLEKLIGNSLFKYHGLDYVDLINPFMSDATIKGKVIAKRSPISMERCLKYKTEYIILVENVIYSNFSLSPGDKVLVKDIMGYEGGCSPNEGDKIRSVLSHVREYKTNDESIFLLQRNFYQRGFLNYHNSTGPYEDEYCPQTFVLNFNSYEYYKYVKEKIPLLKKFFNSRTNGH